MQKGSIHMEPITIKARLNQAYHFSGAAGNGIRFSDLSDGPAFIFREDTSAVHNRFVPAGGCISYASPVRLTRDALPYLLFLYVESGSGTLTNAGDAAQEPESCQLAPGDLMLLPDQTAYRFSTTHTPFCYHCFYLSTEYFSEYLPFLCADDRIFHMSRTEVDDIVWRILPYLSRELLSDEPVSSLHLTAMLSLVLSSLAASRRTASTPSLPAHVARMKEIFDTDYAHSHSLAALESSLGVSRYRLCQDFSDCIGVPPIQYLNRVRLKAARTLLRTTTLTIREVSAAVGIENTTHFINLFKKDAGITPLQFRQSSLH